MTASKFLWPKLREVSTPITSGMSIATIIRSGSLPTPPRYILTTTTATVPRFSWANTPPSKRGCGQCVKNRNNLECALAEAAYMTGLERNADVVRMASYAPLFANSGSLGNGRPTWIWVDSLQGLCHPELLRPATLLPQSW